MSIHTRTSPIRRPWAALFLIIAFLSVSLNPGEARAATAGTAPVESLLPSPGFAPGWVTEGKVETFTEKNLYEHINGEAELYMPYGFQALAAILYAMPAAVPKTALAVDLYRMGSPIDAFGIYSNYRGPDAETVQAGGEGFFDGTQLMFYQDQYFVRMSASGEGIPQRIAFMACATAIAGRLPAAQAALKELDLLKAPGIVPHTERYIAESLLGYAFFKRGLTAEASLDGKTIKVFVVLSESPAAARKALDLYMNHLKNALVEPKISEKAGVITVAAKDPLYKGLILRQWGPYLFGASNLESPEKGAQLLDSWEKGRR